MRRTAAADDALKLSVPARRAVGYIRVSTEEQAEGGMSLETQEAALRRAAAQEGFELVETLRDEGVSAFKKVKRPAFSEVMKRLSEFDVVMVWKLDRFGRRTKDILASVEEITSLGKRFYSVSENLDTETPFGRFTLTILAGLAQLEPETSQTRIIPNVQASIERGLHHGRPPYGYRVEVSQVREVMTFHPDEAPIARRIFSEYAAGAPLYQIMVGLNREGIPAHQGGHWTAASVRTLLQRVAYIGKVEHSRSGQVLEGLHEPLIDLETWEACQRRLKRNGKQPARARNGSLAMLLRCSYCGSPMMVTMSGGKQSYNCRGLYHNPGSHPGLSIRASLTHHYIWGMVDLLLSPKADMQLAIQWSQQNKPPDARLARLREKRDQLETDVIYNLTAAREAGLPHKILAKQNAPLQERLGEVEAEIEALAMEEPRDNIPQLREKMAEARQGSFEAQRLYLSQLFEHVVVEPEALAFHFREDDTPPLRIHRHCTAGMRQHVQDKLP
ncbi:MAG: recombinase family protein, partial [Armatimonadota bacterium]